MQPDELPFPVDPRQASLYTAGWTVGSFHRSFAEGLHSVTYLFLFLLSFFLFFFFFLSFFLSVFVYLLICVFILISRRYFETTGWRGMMESHDKRNEHAQFPTVPSSVFPIYHIFHALLSGM